MAKDKVVKAYLDAYKKLVFSESVSDKTAGPSTAISVPLHFSRNHRVEVTVIEFSAGKYILSDMARTLGELAEGGKKVTQDFRKKAEEIASHCWFEVRLGSLGRRVLHSEIRRRHPTFCRGLQDDWRCLSASA